MTTKYNFRKRPQKKIIFNKNYELSDDDCDYGELLENDSDPSSESSSSESPENPVKLSEKTPEKDSHEIECSSLSSTIRSEDSNDDSRRKRGRDGIDEFIDFIVPDDEEDDYAFDTALLTATIENRIIDEHPSFENKNLYDIIENSLKDAEQSLLDRFCDTKYEDNSWKMTLPKEKVRKLETILEKTKKEIEDEEPTMEKILSIDMLADERRQSIKLFEIYKHMEPFTRERMKRRDELINFLRGVHTKNFEEKLRNEAEEKRIMALADPRDAFSLKTRILKLDTDDQKKKIMLEIYRELLSTPSDSSTYSYLKEKLEHMVSLPYRKLAPFEVKYGENSAEEIDRFYSKIKDKLDNDPVFGLYGMKKAKEEIILALNNRITNPTSDSIIALVSPPGCGKTQLASSLAAAIGFPFERISCAGLSDPVHILGSDSVYIGAKPGVFVKTLAKLGVSNGVVLLDEIDKFSRDEKGEAARDAILHAIDYSSNHDFRDSFLTEFGHDLSNIIFMVSLNDLDMLSRPLRDRLNIIEVEPYTRDDYKQILKFYILPRCLKEVGMAKDSVSIDDGGVSAIINIDTKREGVRSLQKIIKHIVSKINVLRTTAVDNPTFSLGFKILKFSLPFTITEGCVDLLVEKPRNEIGGMMYI